MREVTAGFAICGSFCTFSKVIPQMKRLREAGIELVPIMSEVSAATDTRFGRAEDFRGEIEKICERGILTSIAEVEPIGPKKLLDILIIAPCTGNTLAKLAGSVADSSVTLAAKAHLRNSRPVLIGVSTNDALAGAAKNIGTLLNYKNYYFIPMKQDDFEKKPTSVVADFGKTYEAMLAALDGNQLQPIYC